MAARDQTVRFSFKLASELPAGILQLETINKLIEEQGKIASTATDRVKAANQQQLNDAKAIAQQRSALDKAVVEEMLLNAKTSADGRLLLDKALAQELILNAKTNAQTRLALEKAVAAELTENARVSANSKILLDKSASEQLIAEARADAQERLIIARAEADKESDVRSAALQKELAELRAATSLKKAVIDADAEQKLAKVRAQLLEEAQLRDRATLDFKAELQERLIAAKAEADQETASVRQEQMRQTAIVRGELAEQHGLLKNHSSAYAELRNFVVSAFGVYEIYQFGQAVIDAKSKVDVFRNGMTQLLGNKAEADELYVKVIKLAQTTPYQAEQLFQITGSLKAMGTATHDLIPTLEMLGNVSAIAGTDKLPLIAKAFTDVQNKGVLMKQELNQFSENSVPLLELLAKSLGKTRDEVVQLANDHKISFAQVKQALTDATSVGGLYYNQMIIQSQTLGGQVSNLADKFFFAKARLGDYFENGLKKVISGSADLIDSLTGSGAAMDRTVSIVKAAGAAYLTYHGVLNAAAIAEGVMSTASAIKNGVMYAGQVIYGTYLLELQAVTGQTLVLTASQEAATVAARGLWAAVAANPLGALIAVVGALVTAYYAWDAATIDVSNALGEEEIKLKTNQVQLNGLTKAALQTAMGTDERRKAIQLLIQKYPEYFAGIDTESVTNAQLKKILDAVNDSYQDRIALAREAYKADKLKAAQAELFKQEDDLFARVKKTNVINEEVLASFNGSAEKLLKYIQSNADVSRGLNNEWLGFVRGTGWAIDNTAKSIVENQKNIERETTASAKRVAEIQEGANRTAVAAEDARWGAQVGNLKKGSDIYNAALKVHNDNIAKINGDFQAEEVKGVAAHAGKLKNITVASQKEIKDILLNSAEMTYADKKKYYENLEKLEIEQATKYRVSAKASEEEIAALRANSLSKVATIKEHYHSIQMGLLQQERLATADAIDAEIAAFQKRNSGQQQYVNEMKTSFRTLAEHANIRATEEADAEKTIQNARNTTLRDATTGFKEIAKSATDRQKAEVAAEKDIQSERQKSIALAEKAADVQEKTSRKMIGLAANFLGQIDPGLGRLSKEILTVIDNVNLLGEKSIGTAQKQVEEAQAHLTSIKAIYDAGLGGTAKDIEKAKQAVSEAEMQLSEAEGATASTVFNVMGAVYQIFSALASAYNQMMAETNKAIAESLGHVKQAYTDLYAFIRQAEETYYKESIGNFTGNLTEKLAYIDDYYARQDEYAKQQRTLENQYEFQRKMAESLANGKINAETIMKAIEAARLDSVKRELQAQIDADERAIQKAVDVRDAKIAAIDDALAAKKAALQKEIQDEKDANEKLKAGRQETYDADVAAENERWRTKNNELQDGINRQEKANQAALELAKSTYDQDVANLKSAYDAKIATIKAQESAGRAEIQATYDLQQKLTSQRKADETEELNFLDRMRNEALERYRTAEVDRLNATRNRILLTLADENERRITDEYYNQEIGKVHKEVEEAKLDKSKGVSLATKQLKAEETEQLTQLKKQESADITRLAELTTRVVAQLEAEKTDKLTKLEVDYTNKISTLKEEQFQEMKKLRAEQFVEESKHKDKLTALETAYKSDIEKLRQELTDKIDALQKQETDAEKTATLLKKQANFEYKQTVFQINRDIFEMQKQMKIAELQSDIAVLNSKKNFLNEGKIIQAIGPIEDAIRRLNALSLNDPTNFQEYVGAYDLNKWGMPKKVLNISNPDKPSELAQTVYTKDGDEIEVSYVESTTPHQVFDAAGNSLMISQAAGKVKKTGVKLFATGTEFVDDRNAPDGIDTVAARLTKGERVLTVAQNKLLAGITNTELVRRSQLFETYAVDNQFQWFGGAGGMAALLNPAQPNGEILISEETNRLLSSLHSALADQPHLHVNFDEAGITKSLHTHQNVLTYHTNLLTR